MLALFYLFTACSPSNCSNPSTCSDSSNSSDPYNCPTLLAHISLLILTSYNSSTLQTRLTLLRLTHITSSSSNHAGHGTTTVQPHAQGRDNRATGMGKPRGNHKTTAGQTGETSGRHAPGSNLPRYVPSLGRMSLAVAKLRLAQTHDTDRY